jgi:hypothetical protein
MYNKPLIITTHVEYVYYINSYSANVLLIVYRFVRITYITHT